MTSSPDRTGPPASAATVEPERRREDLRGASILSSRSRLQARLVLVHLHVLALAPVALDQLHLALDLLRPGSRPPSRPARPAPRAGGGRRSSRRGTPSAGGPAAPRRGPPSRPGTPGRARRPAARRTAAGGAPPATRSPRCRGGWWARRACSRSGSAMTRRASAARVCWPPESAVGGRSHSSRAKPRPDSASSTRWSSV